MTSMSSTAVGKFMFATIGNIVSVHCNIVVYIVTVNIYISDNSNCQPSIERDASLHDQNMTVNITSTNACENLQHVLNVHYPSVDYIMN